MLWYNNRCSNDYGIIVETFPDREYPEKEMSITHIPGRNGDYVIDTGIYKNVDRSYNIAILSNRFNTTFAMAANNISKWLHSATGYARLEDSYEPDVYRMALYYEKANVTTILQQAGRVAITFNCKPQRYLKLGEKTYDVLSGSYIENITEYSSKPLIKIYGSGSGSVTIDSKVISFTELPIDEPLIVDSEAEECYTSTELWNSVVSISGDAFPLLHSGNNQVTFSSYVTKVEIIPRWYII